MKNTAFFLILVVPLAAAQVLLNFGAGGLPTCAEDCSTLLNAQTVCVPPAAPVTNQATYVSCFCQSAYLNTLSTTAGVDAICDTTCTSQTDRNSIQSWYEAYCNSGGVTGAASTAAGAAATSRTATGTATAKTTSTSKATTTAVASTIPKHTTWWSVHARWIAMVIVLIIGFATIIIVGAILKKRYNRKHQRAADMAPPVVWGPHQNQAHSGGVSYPGSPVVQEKGKGFAMPAVAHGGSQSQEKKGRSSKLKKFVGV